MTHLITRIAIISRTNAQATLNSIDLANKIITLENDKGTKEISFATAASYKLDTGSADTHNLSAKLLTKLYNNNEALLKKAAHTEPVEIEVDFSNAPDNAPDDAPDDDEVPYGTFKTLAPDSNNPELMYMPDLAEKIGCTQKNLRKRLRKLEAEGFLVKAAHTWCWDPATFAAVIDMLEDKVDKSKDPQDPKTYASNQNASNKS